MITASITIHVEIHDVHALLQAARRHAVEHDSCTPGQTKELVPVGDVSAALRMLFDPGISPDGCQIQDSSVEIDR